ncbi:MAG: sugar ABC transporter permease, partial [Pseudomonadota bacterium]
MFIAPAAVIMAIALIYPLGYMIWGSFRDWDPSQTIGESEFVGLRNYVTLWGDPNFHESLWVTLRFAFFVVTFEMVIGVGLALMLDREIRGMSVLRTMFILPMMIAPVVVGLIWRYMYHPTGAIIMGRMNMVRSTDMPRISRSSISARPTPITISKV